jgi:hypothetical protein
VTARAALEDSLNLPTVRVAMRTGLPQIVTLAKAMGVQGSLQPVPSGFAGTLAPEMRLVEELELDSMRLLTLAMEVEHRFDVSFDGAESAKHRARRRPCARRGDQAASALSAPSSLGASRPRAVRSTAERANGAEEVSHRGRVRTPARRRETTADEPGQAVVDE